MNILFISADSGLAGSTNSVTYLTKGLSERPHQIYLACHKDSLLYSNLIDSKVNLIHIDMKARFDKKAIKQVKQIVRKHNIDLINAQSGLDRYITGFAKLWYRFKAPIIHTRRQMPLSAPGPGMWFYRLSSKKIVAVSEGVKEALIKKGIPRKHLKVIYNGTPKEKYNLENRQEMLESLRKRYKISDSDTVIGSISRHKKQIQILKAARAIDTPLTILLVGFDETPDMKAAADAIADKHRVIYGGRIPNKEALYHYLLLKVFILPSTTEGLSQALLEAMALGVPCIATNASGNNETIKSGENGLLFEDEDIQTLTEHIKTLLTDEALRRKFVANGRKTALEGFSIERTVSNYEKFFQEMIS